MSVAPITSARSVVPPAPDLAALKRGHLDPAAERAGVASQFEAILVRQFMQESIGSMMGGGAGGKGASQAGGGSMYSYMLVDSLAQKLTEGRGLGLAPIIARQLTPRGAASGVSPVTTQ